MKKSILYTFALGCLSLSLSSCGAYLSAGGGYGSPISVYDDGYNVGYSSTYGRIGSVSYTHLTLPTILLV